jgi:hypothetical protein
MMITPFSIKRQEDGHFCSTNGEKGISADPAI